MSPNDVCTACRHPRRRHKDNAGICTEPDTLMVMTACNKTTGVTYKGQPCHCNLFRSVPQAVRQDQDG